MVKIHDMGLSFAEIPIVDPDGFGIHVSKFMELKRALGISYLCHGPREGDPNYSQGLREDYYPKVLKLLKIMPGLEMELLTIHLWMDPRFVRPEVLLFKMDLLAEVVEAADDIGVEVCLENLSEVPEDFLPLFERVPQIGITLDLGHAQLLHSSNVAPLFFKEIPHKIRHVHIHDNLGGSSPRDDLHLPIGKGIIDFSTLLKGLMDTGYNRTITLELRPYEVQGCLERVKALLDS